MAALTTTERLETLELPKEESFYKATTPSMKVFAQPLSMPVDASGVYGVQQTFSEIAQKAEIWSSLVKTTATITPLLNKIQEENKRVQQIEGWMTAASGGQLDEKASKSMMQGYYQYTAELDYSIFNSSIQEYYQQNKMQWESPEEVQKGLNEFLNEWMLARPSNDYYLETFLPHALDIQQSLINDWTQQKVQQINDDIVATSVAGVQNKADAYIQAGLQKFLNVPNINLFDSSFAFDTLEITNEFNEFLRFGLSEVQKEAKAMNLTRLDVSQIYINRIGELAVAYGMPELLNFTDIPDENGIKLNQTVFSNTINQYRTEAMKVKQSKIEQQSKAQEAMDNETVDLLYKQWYYDISDFLNVSKFDPTSKVRFEKYFREEVLNNEYLYKLSDSRFANIVNMANEILYNEHTYSQVSNERTLVELDNAFYKGKLTEEMVTQELLSNNLSLKDYQNYMKKLNDAKELENKQVQQWLNAKTIAAYEVYGITEDEWIQALNTQNFSPAEIDKITGIMLSQREAEAKTLEDYEKQKLMEEEAMKAMQRKENYLNLKNRLAKNEFIKPEEIIEMYASNELEATDADKLLGTVYSIIDDVKTFKTRNFDKMIEKTIQMYAGSIYAIIWNSELEAVLYEKANELATQFYEINDLTRPDIHILFRDQVLTPLEEYAQQYTSSGELGQKTMSMGATYEEMLKSFEEDKKSTEPFWKKAFNKLFGKEEEITTNAYISPNDKLYSNITNYTLPDVIRELETAGLTTIDAKSMAYDETRNFIVEKLKAGADPAKLQIYLVTQKGFTDAEARKIITEVIKTYGADLMKSPYVPQQK